MIRAPLKNRTFTWMGERYAPLIDPYHLMGHGPFDKGRFHGIPAVNVKSDGKIYEMSLAIPGYCKEDLTVTVADDVLSVRGEKQKLDDKASSEYVMQEFTVDSFERRFKLAKHIGQEKIEAKYEHGILKLTFIDVPVYEEKKYKTVAVE